MREHLCVYTVRVLVSFACTCVRAANTCHHNIFTTSLVLGVIRLELLRTVVHISTRIAEAGGSDGWGGATSDDVLITAFNYVTAKILCIPLSSFERQVKGLD